MLALGLCFALTSGVVRAEESSSLPVNTIMTDTLTDYRQRMPAPEFLQEFREDPEFQYVRDDVASHWGLELERWLQKLLFREPSSLQLGILNIIFVLVVIAFLVFLIYKLVRGHYFRGPAPLRAGGEMMSGERVDEVAYPQLLRQALDKEDFALAVRVNYWYVLHLMDGKGIICWEPYKTNRAYAQEVKDQRYGECFKKLSRIFDCVCYGDFEIDTILYHELEQEFLTFQRILDE